VNRRATDVDRAFSAIGVHMNYVTFGPRKLPETTKEMGEIFFYNDQGEGDYRAPKVAEEESALLLPGLPGAVQEQVAPETHAPEPVVSKLVPPELPQRLPEAPSQPAPVERAPERPIPIAARAQPPQSRSVVPPQNPIPLALPQRQPPMGAPIQPQPPQPVWRPNLIRPESRPEAPRPGMPLHLNEGFGLPEVWRERQDVRNPATAPVVEERSLAAMFRMLGNRANGSLTGAPGDDDEPTDPSGDDLFRRL